MWIQHTGWSRRAPAKIKTYFFGATYGAWSIVGICPSRIYTDSFFLTKFILIIPVFPLEPTQKFQVILASEYTDFVRSTPYFVHHYYPSPCSTKIRNTLNIILVKKPKTKQISTDEIRISAYQKNDREEKKKKKKERKRKGARTTIPSHGETVLGLGWV